MITRLVWKLVVTALILLWSIASFLPLNDIDYEEYLLSEVSASQAEFEGIVQEARDLIENDENVSSMFIALRQLGEENAYDYVNYFPHINLSDIANQDKRNEILLNYLLQQSRGRLKQGLDLAGGVSFTLEMDAAAAEQQVSDSAQEQLSKAINIMADRIDGLGVAEPVIRAVGENRIEVQLPDVSTVENPEIIDSLKKPAKLEFKLVHRDRNPQFESPTELPPPGFYKLILEREERTGEIVEIPHYIKRIPEATGEIIDRAVPTINETGGFEVQLVFTSEGSDIFADITGQIAAENDRIAAMTGQQSIGQLAIILDGLLYSAPTVREEIRGGNAVITGNFTQREAIDLSNVLNNPLAVELEVAQMAETGPTLAEEARKNSINAAMIGGSLVVGFMILYYWLGGAVAVISVVTNLVILIGILASFGATMTLPGVAALVLTIGMAVDANILIFERIREELRLGKSTVNALRGGYEKALSTIVDANVTTMITAIILIWLGTGPVKGFGVTLSIGIGASMFCALVVSRLILEFLVEVCKVDRIIGFSLFGKTNIDFLKFRKPAFLSSWVIVLIGVGWLITHNDNIFGIDFVGGDELTVGYQEEIAAEEFQAVADAGGFGEVNAVYQTVIGTDSSVIKIQTELDKGGDYFEALSAAHPEAMLDLQGETQIGASVSGEIQQKAFLSVAVALLGILLYVALRFEVGYGIGAVVATIHDVLMTLGIFVLFGGQFTAPMIAAVLMILGYSINDTIVVFDRIREELGLNPDATLSDVIRMAINRVLSRSILTSITTLLSAITLWVFGSGIIVDFAFVFMVGILTGTFSSIFIASPVFYWWHKGDRKHVEEREWTPKYDWQASSKTAEAE